jgi:pyrimidine-nucleoside phosphorylase
MKLATDLIRKKRDGEALTADELSFLVEGFSRGGLPDYQISAWLMAVYLRGMTVDETVTLTRLMKNSGESMEWRSLSDQLGRARFVDKHSTGGVGDKVSLVLAPLAALLDLCVPMISGRGLGHTGGTVDKLESIPGFSMYLPTDKLVKGLVEIGAVMMAQSPSLCPADKKLYALRDVTSTVESIPLITASIVSKKWAEGVEAIVYDVKCGVGAFMKYQENARELARSLVKTSQGAGIRAVARITRMEEPLGPRIGNSLEVEECYWMLSQNYPSKLMKEIAAPLEKLCCELTAEMAVIAGSRKDYDETVRECENNLKNGRALKKFEEMLHFQGAVNDWLEKLPRVVSPHTIESAKSGYVKSINSYKFGVAGLPLGVGRLTAEDSVDPATGFELQVKVGDRVTRGQPLVRVFSRSRELTDSLTPSILSAIEISESPQSPASDLSLERVM